MKRTMIGIVAGMALALTASAQPKQQPKPQPASPAEATYQDIKATLGSVPSFFRAFPEEGIAAAWAEMRAVQLDPKTALTPRTKELIGLGVAAQIPCRYCVYFHTQAARANGAGDRELKEAIAIAASSRHWSTLMFGAQLDPIAWKGEVTKMMAHVRRQMSARTPAPDVSTIVDEKSAYADMQKVLGAVPSYMRRLPPAAVAPAWRLLRTGELSGDTALTPKEKALIGLAVDSQSACPACVVFCTEAAKLHGATDAEIREAVAMSAVTRLWSTVLNGSLLDEAQFRTEVDQVMAHVRRGQKAATR